MWAQSHSSLAQNFAGVLHSCLLLLNNEHTDTVQLIWSFFFFFLWAGFIWLFFFNVYLNAVSLEHSWDGFWAGWQTFSVQKTEKVFVNFGQIKQEENFAVGSRMAWFSLSGLCTLPLSSLPSSETRLDVAQISLFTGMWKDSFGQQTLYRITRSLSVSVLNYSCCFLSCQQHKSSIKSLSPMASYLS